MVSEEEKKCFREKLMKNVEEKTLNRIGKIEQLVQRAIQAQSQLLLSEKVQTKHATLA